MKIPITFRAQTAQIFYDKSITIYQVLDTTDNEGWQKKLAYTITGSFMGNVRSGISEQMQKDYGLTIDQNSITITTSQVVAEGSILGYGGLKYMVIKANNFDTHNVLICNFWRPLSSTYVSA